MYFRVLHKGYWLIKMTSRAPTSTEAPKQAEIPDIIRDPNTKKNYEKGRFLGKGGFAKCFEMKDMQTGEITAGKIVPKSLLQKSHQRSVSNVKC